MPRPRNLAPQLPKSLREELGLDGDIGHGAQYGHAGRQQQQQQHAGRRQSARRPLARKERRKAEREQKKAVRRNIHAGGGGEGGGRRRSGDSGGDGGGGGGGGVLSRLDGQHGRRVAAPSKKEKKTTGASERAEQSGPPLAPPAPLKSILKRPKEIQETTGTVGKRRTAQDRTASGRDGDGGGDDKDDSDVDDESAEDTSRPPKVSKRVSEALGRDDAEIAALEKKLGIKGKKKKRDKEAADGLDELLGALGGESSSDSETGRKRKRMDYEEWLSSKRQKAAHGGGETSEDDEPGSGPAFEPGSPESVTDDAEDLTGVDDNDDDDGENDDDNEDEEHSESDSAASDGVGESSPSPTKSKTVPAQRRARENPYLPPPVAPHSKDTLTTTNTTPYVPPARRRQGTQEEAAGDDNDDSARRRIRRQAQGLLNRLSESNLISLLSEVEQLYRAHPRQQVTSTLTDILVDLVGDQAALSDSFLILHAGFIAAMYKVIGMDLGAAVLHRVVERFDAKYAVASSNADNDAVGGGGGGGGGGDGDMGQTGREVFNLISLVAELYNIQAISSALVYDFIRLFLDKITEMNTELLLRIVKSSGPQLRQDDPSSLKDIVLLLRQKIGEAGGEAKLGVRTRFMIDTINDLKNNRLGRKHALANASSSSSSSSLRAELLTRMRKTLGTLSARKLQSTEPLRFSLAAVRNSDKRGSWWLPGRAAATSVGTGAGAGPEKHARAHQPPHNGRGDALGGSDGDYNANDEDNDDEELAEGALGTASLLQLAKQQRMNTDVRRAIFVALMSASDCRDAQFRLAKLRLKRAQEAEIPRVLMQCAGAEPAYNPYYTLVAQKLLLAGGAGQRRLHMAFQFALWNVFRAMGDGGGDEDDDYDDGYRDDDDDDEEGQGVDGRTEGAMGMRKIVNLAKMYGALVAARALSLGVLKVLNLAYLQPKTQLFVEVFFIGIFLFSSSKRQQSGGRKGDEEERDNNKKAAVQDIFMDLRDNPPLARGVQYFLAKVVSKTDIAGGKAETAAVKRGCRLAGEVLARIVALDVVED